jgi:predicted RNase H-like HicB family nuclease
MKTQAKHDFSKYLKLPYAIHITADECGGKPCFMAYHPELDGCMAQGDTPVEAVKNLASAREDYIKALLNMGQPVPLPKGIVSVEPARDEAQTIRVNMGTPSYQVTLQKDIPLVSERPRSQIRTMVMS